MNEYINIYGGTVTAGGTDGDLISQNDTQTNPITVSLDATNSETKYIKCALRCTDGFESNRTAISFTGLTREKWEVALDNGYTTSTVKTNATFSSQLVITNIIDNTNTIIWFKVTSSVDEKPRKDISVSVKLDTYIITA